MRRPLNPTIQNSLPKLAIRTPSRCLNPALISAAPHYGLRYGSAPASGNFQRLRGRPPLVSPLKSCMRRSSTAVPTEEKDQLRIGLTPKRALCPFCVLRN